MVLFFSVVLLVVGSVGNSCASEPKAAAAGAQEIIKPNAEQALQVLKDGNARFVAGKSSNPNCDMARANLAGKSDQGDYAYATIISCSDSRVPVERIFDTGIMDLFIVRVAGNVVDGDEAGSIEYGLGHVHTPLLVVLGHSQCGAVTAVAAAVEGHGHALERNIPALVDNIAPAVKRAQKKNPGVQGAALIPFGIEENVWQGIEDLFMRSPATREQVKSGKVKVVGALYDVSSGSVSWLPEAKVVEILAQVEKSPKKAVDAPQAAEHGGEHKKH
jgi:carbonic anhydrase